MDETDLCSSSGKLLLITKKLNEHPQGGRELLCKLNYDALFSLYGDNLTLLELQQQERKTWNFYWNALRGYIDGLDGKTVESIVSLIGEGGIGKVFVDGSNLGGVIPIIKRKHPKVQILTFFHNVEAKFFWGSFKSSKTLHKLLVLIVNYLAERKAVRLSNRVIALSRRDGMLLKKIYGRSATHISSIALEDKVSSIYSSGHKGSENSALFVGGSFYANREGITWFVRHVVPLIDLPIYIVGRGFEDLRDELEVPEKVIVVGNVENVSEWYIRCQFVIAPIFDGSGMKTKVAEAMMFGKKVVGTPEAFSGYEDVLDQVGWVCHSIDDFVTSIAIARRTVADPFDRTLRDLYERHYSAGAALTRLESILK